MEPRLIKVSFEAMLRSECKIVCVSSSLNNSKNRYGVDFTQPMVFNEFLELIGTHLTGMNCKSLFQQAEWYIWTDDSDEIIEKYFIKSDNNNGWIYTINIGTDGKNIEVEVYSPFGFTMENLSADGIVPPFHYKYTWIDKYIRKVTLDQKVNSVKEIHERFWNRRGKKTV